MSGFLRSIINFFKPRSEEHLRSTIQELIGDQPSQDPMAIHERVLLSNTLKLRDKTVLDVMVPRVDIIAAPMDSSFDTLIDLMIKEGHSRLPIYRETLDDVAGIIHIKDMLKLATRTKAEKQKFDSAKILREILFVAPSMPVLDLLMQMRETHRHMALVVDEFGGIDGLITIEDLVEEIVGEIEDEHDILDAPIILQRKDGTLVLESRVSLEDFEEHVGKIFTKEEHEESDTIGGLVYYLAGRVPTRGELISHPSGMVFEIIDADQRRIKRIRVHHVPGQYEKP